ncbi:PadR family transcriptional regulator [Tepidibacillus marianensis]|uniref:PadR family transcriptional regulator n=1 Tax=Tepidibacillus marianensis TaxID=3131995 RepID=UPI0030CFBBE9
MPRKHGRHAPAFLLLLLTDAPYYGALLLTKLETELPYCFFDSAIVYRSLQEMEKNELVEASWETPETGPPRKWYTITPKGEEALNEFAEEIRQRQANFEFFLSQYKSLNKDKDK